MTTKMMTDNNIYKKYNIGKYTYGSPNIIDRG